MDYNYTEEQLSRLTFLNSAQKEVDQRYELGKAVGLEDVDESDEDSIDPDQVKKAAIDRITEGFRITNKFKDPLRLYTDRQSTLSYPISRIIVSLTDNPFLFYLYSVSEARRFVNLSKKSSEEVASSRDIETKRYDQVTILQELGYNSVTTETIPIELYLSVVPSEYESLTKSSQRYNNFSDTIEATNEVLDTVLFWILVREIRERLPMDVPEPIKEELESEVVLINQKIPSEFKISQRGLSKDATDISFSELVDHLPYILKETAHNIQSGNITNSTHRQMVLRTFMDCDAEVDEIVEWMDYDSEWTQKYGRDELFEMQGDIQHTQYGFITYSLQQLQENGIFEDAGTIYEIANYSPVYTILSNQDQLYPYTIRTSS